MEGAKAGTSSKQRRSMATDQTEAGGKKRRNMQPAIGGLAQHQMSTEFGGTATMNVHQQSEQRGEPNLTGTQQQSVVAMPGDFVVVTDGVAQQQQHATRISISYTKPFVTDQQQQLIQQQNEQTAILERIRRRQLSELAAMEAAKPLPDDLQFCVEYNAHGLTDIGYLLMGWREQMLISRLTGIVAQSAVMGGTNAKFRGRKIVLQFDREATQLLTVKEWERHDNRPSELARAQPGDRVFLQRLNVTQGKGGGVISAENTFLFSVTFGQFSTMQIMAHAGSEWTAGLRAAPILAITDQPEDCHEQQQQQKISTNLGQQQQMVGENVCGGGRDDVDDDDDDILFDMTGTPNEQPKQNTVSRE